MASILWAGMGISCPSPHSHRRAISRLVYHKPTENGVHEQHGMGNVGCLGGRFMGNGDIPDSASKVATSRRPRSRNIFNKQPLSTFLNAKYQQGRPTEVWLCERGGLDQCSQPRPILSTLIPQRTFDSVWRYFWFQR